MDRKNIVIAGLSASAFLLLIVLTVIQLFSAPQVVLAGGQVTGGDYIVTSAKTANDEDAIWVMDTRSRNIGIYQFDNSSRRLELRKLYSIAQTEQLLTR
jgi:secreted trypsin-like serine protease